MYYCCNFLAYLHFKALILNLEKDIVCHEIKQIMARIKIKLSKDNVTSKTIKQFCLNNINAIFHVHTSFTWFFIKTAVNIVTINNSMPNFSSKRPTLIDVESNAVVDFNLDNSSSNKKSYLSNDCGFSFNSNYY